MDAFEFAVRVPGQAPEPEHRPPGGAVRRLCRRPGGRNAPGRGRSGPRRCARHWQTWSARSGRTSSRQKASACRACSLPAATGLMMCVERRAVDAGMPGPVEQGKGGLGLVAGQGTAAADGAQGVVVDEVSAVRRFARRSGAHRLARFTGIATDPDGAGDVAAGIGEQGVDVVAGWNRPVWPGCTGRSLRAGVHRRRQSPRPGLRAGVQAGDWRTGFASRSRTGTCPASEDSKVTVVSPARTIWPMTAP